MRTLLFSLLFVLSTSSHADDTARNSPASHVDSATIAEQATILDTPTGKIIGSLQLPTAQLRTAAGRVPLAIIVAGSGPTDRNGNSSMLPGPNNSLKQLAQALADAGIASVRYDKRGIAASAAAGPVESALRFDNYVNDASGWVQKMKQDERFSSVAIIGHSEGSLIAMLAARQARADAYVSIAGPAQGAADVLRKQLRPKLNGAAAAENERVLLALEHGILAGDVPAGFAALYRPSIQPYLISWFRYVPAVELAKLDIPVLIVQGSTDLQITVADAEALKKAKPSATLAIVRGMNHVLKLVDGDLQEQIGSYSNAALPLAPELVKSVTQFLKANLK